MQYCEKCKEFTFRKGIKYGNICKKCITRDMKKRGIFNDPNFELNNPKTHAKTIKSQIKNGKGVAGDPKIREKSRESFKKNKIWEDNPNWGTKNPETWRKTINNREENALKAGYSSFNDFQIKVHGKKSVLNNPEIYKKTRESIALKKSNIIYNNSNNKKYYNHYPIEKIELLEEINENFVNDILNNNKNIDKYPALDLIPNHILYNGFDILTGEQFKKRTKLIEFSGVKYFIDSNGNIVLWDEYKENFKYQNNINSLDDFLNMIKKDFSNAFIQSTFRTQDSQDWSGARIAFEQNLVDLEVNWFVYIKFYIDSKGIIKPLVVGKSGSLLVNSNGSDVSFSENIKD